MPFDYDARLVKLQEDMKENSIDAFIVSTQEGIYYLTGASYQPLERPFFVIVRPEGKFDLVVPFLEFEHMKKVQNYREIRYYFEYPSVEGKNWYDLLNYVLGPKDRVGIEPGFSSAKRELLKVGETVVYDALPRLRMVKEPEEISAVQDAATWTDKGMSRLYHGIYRGCCVLETVTHAKSIQTGVIKTGEYDYMNCSFLTAGWPAPNSAQPHSVPDFHLTMGDGPIVLMSFNRVNGYAAECERTVFLGEPSKRDFELFHLVLEARELAYSMVRPGASCAEIDQATQDFFASKGYGDKIIHRTGHGIGLGNHEQPWLSRGSEDVLKENMIISIEPALYFPEIGGFRLSDTVLVTKDGYEILTKYPSDPESLIIRDRRIWQRFKGAVIRKAMNV